MAAGVFFAGVPWGIEIPTVVVADAQSGVNRPPAFLRGDYFLLDLGRVPVGVRLAAEGPHGRLVVFAVGQIG